MLERSVFKPSVLHEASGDAAANIIGSKKMLCSLVYYFPVIRQQQLPLARMGNFKLVEAKGEERLLDRQLKLCCGKECFISVDHEKNTEDTACSVP